MTLRTLNYGNYGLFLNMGSAGFTSSTVVARVINMGSAGFTSSTVVARVINKGTIPLIAYQRT